jgi:hypothetical protein
VPAVAVQAKGTAAAEAVEVSLRAVQEPVAPREAARSGWVTYQVEARSRAGAASAAAARPYR